MHQHKCSLCATTWQHGEELDNVIWAHECPKCGCHQFRVVLANPTPPPPVETALAQLSDAKEFVRSTTIFGLDVRTAPAELFVPRLAELAIQDPEPMVRLAAVETLWRFGSQAVAAVEALARALEDKRSEVRRAAALTLGNLGPSAGTASPALIGTQQDKNPRVRQAVAMALSRVSGVAAQEMASASDAGAPGVWFSINS